MAIGADLVVGGARHAHHDRDLAFLFQKIDEAVGRDLGLLAKIIADAGEIHVGRGDRVEHGDRYILADGLFERGAIAGRVEKIDGDSIGGVAIELSRIWFC